MRVMITIVAFLVILGLISYILKITNIPARFMSDETLKGDKYKKVMAFIYVPIIVLFGILFYIFRNHGYYTNMILACLFIGLCDGIFGNMRKSRYVLNNNESN